MIWGFQFTKENNYFEVLGTYYTIAVGLSTTKALKTRLQTCQNKLVRLLLSLPPRSHLTPAHFFKVGWLRVEDRVKQLALGLVYKIHYTSLIPSYLSNYFQNVKDRHDHYTRGSETNHVKQIRNQKRTKLILPLRHNNVERTFQAP